MDFPPTLELFREQKTARVERTITPDRKGRVFYEGTYWPAQFYANTNFPSQDNAAWVTVIGRQGLTLLVKPVTAVMAV